MIDTPDSSDTLSPEAPKPGEDDAEPSDRGEDRAAVLHRMSQRFGQRIEKTRGASRAYLKLLE